MAHFAKLDENNIVLEVHAVSNEALDPENEEATGIAFLTEWSGGYENWKQTSYNANFRKNYAGIGFTYFEHIDAFVAPKPFNSWSLNHETAQWEAPIAKPTDGLVYAWDESELDWKPVVFEVVEE